MCSRSAWSRSTTGSTTRSSSTKIHSSSPITGYPAGLAPTSPRQECSASTRAHSDHASVINLHPFYYHDCLSVDGWWVMDGWGVESCLKEGICNSVLGLLGKIRGCWLPH